MQTPPYKSPLTPRNINNDKYYDISNSVFTKIPQNDGNYSINYKEISLDKMSSLPQLYQQGNKIYIRIAEVCDENNMLCKYKCEYNGFLNFFTIIKYEVDKESLEEGEGEEILFGTGKCDEFRELVKKDFEGCDIKELCVKGKKEYVQ